MKHFVDKVLFLGLCGVIGYYGYVFAVELLKSDGLEDISKFITIMVAAFVIGTLFGILTMLLKTLLQGSELKGYKRELEKESISAAENSSKVKVLESKIEVLEKALKEALAKNNEG